jgi:hypothetical protein
MKRIALAFVIAGAMAVLVLSLELSREEGPDSQPRKSAPTQTGTIVSVIHGSEEAPDG